MLVHNMTFTRRRALEFLGGTLAPCIALGNPPPPSEALFSSLPCRLIDALEERGQWATGLSWANDIHQSMGAKVTVVARGTASGHDSAAAATELALQRLILNEPPPDGAVVVVYGRPGELRLRDVHGAYQVVRKSIQPGAYCAYSPLFEEGPDDHVLAEVTLGWRIHRTKLFDI